MYCGIPKVATKALLTTMYYVHLRDISEHLINNWTNTDAATARMEQRINISALIQELRKNGIKIPKGEEPKSLAEFLRTYLNILRFGNINTTSTSPPLNPWRIFSPSFTRAIFVRHPFDRLASAYKERIATLPKDRIQAEPGYDAMRERICLQHRMVNWIPNLLPKRDVCKDNIPSFEVFIKFILGYIRTPAKMAQMDGHWQPYSMLCQVCKLKYNFIGKYETFNDDFTYFLKRLNLSDWNIEKRHGASGQTKQYYQQLYSTLPDELICQLMRLYDEDFRHFNYRVDDYINRTTLIQSCNQSRIFEPVASWSQVGIDHSFKPMKKRPFY